MRAALRSRRIRVYCECMRLLGARTRVLASLGCGLLLSGLLVAGCAAPATPPPGASAPSLQTVATSAPATTAVSSIPVTASPPATDTAQAAATTPAPEPSAVTSAQRDPRLYPDPRLTPGDVLPVTAAQVSVSGYSSKVRNVPVSEKREVFAEYRLTYPQKAGAYECDHFIPLCLGGSNSIRNLWPEPAPQFHWKDGLEVYLWRQLRAGKITLAEAQREIRTDWYAYWVGAGKPGSTADADSAAVQAPPPTSRAGEAGLVVGWSASPSGRRYHYLNCRYYAQIAPANRRTGTVSQAQAAGKTPCRVCKPPQ